MKAILKNDIHQSKMKKFDKGFIDGYVSDGEGRPMAVFVREDGYIDLVPIHSIEATR
jgi:hypothetical protein